VGGEALALTRHFAAGKPPRAPWQGQQGSIHPVSFFLARPWEGGSSLLGGADHPPLLKVRSTPQGDTAEGQAEYSSAGDSPMLMDVHGEWRWDGQTVTVRTCRYGFFPLYYCADGESFLVSPSLYALLAAGVPRDLDDDAVAVFLRLGFMVGEDTPFKSIRVVPPNAVMSWTRSRLEISARPCRAELNTLSRDSAIDGYIQLFRQSMQRRLPVDGDYAVPLSGGRDSRHILLELLRAGYKPGFCITTHEFPPYSEEDIRVAGLLAERAGVPHIILPQTGSRILTEVRKNRVTGLGAMEHAWSLVLAGYLGLRTSWVYDGLAGDFLSGGAQLIPEQVALYEQGKFEELALRLLSNWLSYSGYEEVLGRLLKPESRRRFSLDAAVQRLAAVLAGHADAPNPLGSFHVWQRARRGISLYTFGVLADRGIAAVTPYLDADLFDFLSSLPTSLFIDKSFHTETLRRAFPDYADIPFEDETAPQIKSNGHFRRILMESAAYIATRGTGKHLDKHYLVPRLLDLVLRPKADLHKKMAYLAPLTAVYLAQLEAAEQKALEF
jgi:asparagine synthase (glutamine-hydrolysing)